MPNVRPVQPDVILRLFCAEERVRHIEHQVNIVKTALRAQFLRVVQRFDKVGVRGCRLDQKTDAEPLCVLPDGGQRLERPAPRVLSARPVDEKTGNVEDLTALQIGRKVADVAKVLYRPRALAGVGGGRVRARRDTRHGQKG